MSFTNTKSAVFWRCLTPLLLSVPWVFVPMPGWPFRHQLPVFNVMIVVCLFNCSIPRYRVNLLKWWTRTTQPKSSTGRRANSALNARWRSVRRFIPYSESAHQVAPPSSHAVHACGAPYNPRERAVPPADGLVSPPYDRFSVCAVLLMFRSFFIIPIVDGSFWQLLVLTCFILF